MKKIVLLISFILIGIILFAQDEPKPETKKKPTIVSRANDHLLIQFGYTGWSKIPDSINTKGFPRTFNAYFVFDFPFKSNPKISVAIGAGVGTDNIYFDKTYVGIKDITPTLQFHDLSDTTHFKKSKLATTYLEAPLELRFNSRPDNPNKGVKVALGVKAGVLVQAHIKQKTEQTSSGGTINAYTEKESSKRFFNKNRFVATARVGLGHFTLYGNYQLNSLFKEGAGPQVKPFSIGITLSGL